MTQKPLEGKNALVTGAYRNLGSVTAETLARYGANVVINDRLWSIRLHVEFSDLPDSWLRATWFLFQFEFLVSSWRGVPRSRENPLDGGNLLTQQVLYTDFATFPAGANFNYSVGNPGGY